MNKYEMLYIISPSINEETRETLIKKFNDFIISNGGTVESTDKWGIKRLAYPIKFKNDGFYVLVNFSAAAGVSSEMEALMHITDGILRTLIVRKNA